MTCERLRMKITIITACYNSIATIRDAIESVKSQKLPEGVELEHLIIDGGSTDGTEKLATISERDRGMYDAINKGIKMATGDVIGILNADDVLASDDVIVRIAEAFQVDDMDAIYADIRFVRELGGPTVRYCTGKFFRPWMFRFGTQVAHPSFFARKSCFEKYGGYSLDYGMYGDFELLCRFIWKHRIHTRYLPFCTTVMRLGGASTSGWRATVKINRSNLRALRANGCYSNYLFLYSRYFIKIWGFVFRHT